ncbi:LacI family DNA-binding transcriptional regulator [Paenibacillus yanchengensis]|uniref:LacI family DNA-binding transcriptional regulator n=1 Tax=Paenibacillus yanchengensis TaxID=2035833 RepID=A0ABW4YJF0_9BACL
MNITIKDIARVTNVSPATVSRVLNNVGGYNEATRKKVLQAAAELGYRRNESARSLVKNSSNLIGVIMPQVSTLFYGDIMTGIERAAHQSGYSIIISHSGNVGDKIPECIKLMAERKVDGLIIATVEINDEHLAMVQELRIPYLLLATRMPDRNVPYLKVNDFDAAYTATHHLIENGHEKIGLVGLSLTDRVAGTTRFEGYKRALEDNGLKFDPHLVKEGDYGFYSGQRAMQSYLQEKTELTAVFCVSDDVALGVISVAADHGIQIPDDLSVVGYDNTIIAEMSIPPLTSIDQPFMEMGEEGCSMVIDAIRHKQKIYSKIMPYTLVERRSVKQITHKIF